MNQIILHRIYDKSITPEGIRILIDRLWPRGLKKEDANIDYWFKEVAPSSELRKWFGHKPERFEEFRLKYFQELRNDEEKCQKVDEICQMLDENNVILLYGAKDTEKNHAVVLKEEILNRCEM
ncbi:hypothetical protein B4064_2167 [Caldibacillus thermoamylovorans]|jgi:uncharacterized protein YeaO (DUF488 family)|uniref:DUF488 domain-containing protein n=1 Tax=Bacillaceae TaxID=186817 RepID=UPI0005A44DFB|nr:MULTISPECIES: DUF488 family protein [Bacillaceae]KIO66630.1 hypothetical protein B4064_2167 [Caldibacillus thermoamylovorans]MDL0421474.1 DUF488 family protein [Caldibacillus thermoamylovorans]MEC5271549.1 DUF488 family protein [Caldifermentibacillus hisashii]MED3644384.1 DUF488 family protein [Caldifermentibacillus hisashii]MED4850722.1 DUF488 family protein [Caldifermentibacillus hisashii]